MSNVTPECRLMASRAVAPRLMLPPSVMVTVPGVVAPSAATIAAFSPAMSVTVVIFCFLRLKLSWLGLLRRRIIPRLQRAGPLEFGNQRRQPPRIGAPAAKTARVHGLAHLRAAHRAHAAVGFVKAFASGVGRQPKMRQHARQSAGEIRHPVGELD